MKRTEEGEGRGRGDVGWGQQRACSSMPWPPPLSSQDPRASNKHQLKALQKKTGLVGVGRVPDHLPGDVQVGANTVSK